MVGSPGKDKDPEGDPAKPSERLWEELLKKTLQAQTAEVKQTSPVGISEEKESSTYLEAFRVAEDQRHRHREFMTPALRNIAYVWIGTVVSILILQGFGAGSNFFHLSDSVLLTLLTTTTVNILGLFLIALNYLYAKQDRIVKATTIKQRGAPADK
jgi:hypothetical protein